MTTTMAKWCMTATNMKLKMLKPRLTTATTQRIKTVEAGTWSKDGKSMYGWEWQKARLIYLQNNPLCVHCKSDGRTTLANVVDHKTPHRGNEALFWSQTNWQGLCKPCHDSKTAKEDGGFGNIRR